MFLKISQNLHEKTVPESVHISLIHKAWINLINVKVSTGVVL